MNYEKQLYKNMRIILVIFIILISLASIIPYSFKSEKKIDSYCLKYEDESPDESVAQQEYLEEDIRDQLNCFLDPNKEMFNLFILGIINIDELSMWVLGVDRRLIVLKMMHNKRLMQASDIAETTERSLQNISYAMRELEERGLIKCLTPGKHTWKKFIPTEKGKEVFEKLKKNQLID